MKLFVWITFLALAAETYAATVVPAALPRARLAQRGDGTTSLKKTGEALESIGKILQSQGSLLTPEQLETALKGVMDPDSEEYGLFVTILAAILKGAASGAAGAAVTHFLNKG
ncbi:uncharacterized protein LOC144169478 [Haemaphysalis longicornis]